MTYDVAFVIEDVLGHRTHAANLQRHAVEDPEVRAHWAMLGFEVTGLGARVPVFRSNWTVRAGIRARRELRRLHRRSPLDAIFFHSQAMATLSGDWLRRVPSVISLDATPRQFDELGAFYAHSTMPGPLEAAKSRVAAARFARARHLVTWSEWAKLGLVDDYGVPEAKVTVVPPGVSTAEWARPTATRSDEIVRVLFVGADFERKGGLTLLEAFRSVREMGVELHVVTRDDVAEEPGLHVHHGLVANSAELKSLYHASDVFVLPTRGDCLPLVLCEAGSAGLPIVSTRVGGIPEIVRDGETGLIVPLDDAPALAAALARLIANPEERREMGRRSTEHVRRHYDAAVNTQRLLDILKQVADGASTVG